MSAHKILLVDDDSDVIEILSQVLQRAGFEVESAADGAEALSQVTKSRPSVVVTDVMLPRVDGWRMCQKLKSDPSTRSIQILVMTAKSEDIAELMSYESGADGFITKPFDNNEFVEAVRKLAEKS